MCVCVSSCLLPSSPKDKQAGVVADWAWGAAVCTTHAEWLPQWLL